MHLITAQKVAGLNPAEVTRGNRQSMFIPFFLLYTIYISKYFCDFVWEIGIFFKFGKMIGKFFTFLGDIARGLGLVVGSAIMFVVFALYGYFILWVVKFFSALMVDAEWITNQYVLDFWGFIFLEHITYTEVIVAIGFGMAGVFKLLDGSKE